MKAGHPVRALLLTGALALGGATEPARSAEATITVLVTSGTPIPDGTGRFAQFLSPTLNDLGKVAFFATLDGTTSPGDNEGIYLGDTNALVQIVREGQAAPDGNGFFGTFSPGTILAINNSCSMTTGAG
ncbi:MAG: hypothetical protein KF833_06520 [Verrucomicrobiae bacterium]|nr:hypothetical protein [Verrucomicrobiae bacterium]